MGLSRRFIAEVLSNNDIVECILASLGSNAHQARGVGKAWRNAAQRVLARCHVVKLEASHGTYWSRENEAEVNGIASMHRRLQDVQSFGLEVNMGACRMVATPTGLLLSDGNNGRILVLDPTGQPEQSFPQQGYPTALAYGFESIFVSFHAGSNQWKLDRMTMSGEPIGFPSSPVAVRSVELVGDSLFVSSMNMMNEFIIGHSGIVHEYEADTASFLRVFCEEEGGVTSMAGLGETLLLLVRPDEEDDEQRCVSTHSLVTGELWAQCAVPDSAVCLAAQHDRLFVATMRLPRERGQLHVMLLDGTPLQRLEVHATGGPADLRVAHGKLYCLCFVEFAEDEHFMDERANVMDYLPLGGDEEMHALCVYNLVGAPQHF